MDMTLNTNMRKALRQWLIQTIASDSAKPIASLATHEFKVSRQTINLELRAMVAEGLLVAGGNTRARRYRLKELQRFSDTVEVKPGVSEDTIWRQKLAPLLTDLPLNIQRICQHGFTEMFNNVIDHSGAKQAVVLLIRTAATVRMLVTDRGVGIFEKIKDACHLEDTRHAIFELTKGKLTTDPRFHTGEGIFFTSRMFDRFDIYSDALCLVCTADRGDWLFEIREQAPVVGTNVSMTIGVFTQRTVKEVLDKFASGDADYGFSKTHIPVNLAQYGIEQLVSRSQAKRVMAHIPERFNEVVLDFAGVESIGQAFADEIFRVFTREHPDIHLSITNQNDEVQAMINRAYAGSGSRQRESTEEKDSRGDADSSDDPESVQGNL